MDFFLAGCQGAGLAVGAGALAGAFGRRDAAGLALLAIAVVAGAALYGISLEDADHPAWPGWILGALIAAGSFEVVSGFAAGASERAEGGGLTGALIAIVALVVAGLSLVVEPVGLVALLAVVYLSFARRSRMARKYEGLRSLR